MNKSSLILGTRGSALALAQSRLVRSLLLRAFPRLTVEIKIIKTSGDKATRASLSQSGIKGLFTRELEQALIRKKIDAAVHSLKDLPTELPSGLVLGAVAEREEALDIVIGHPATSLAAPSVLYTSSPRRLFQLQLLWPGCDAREIRGNVETRLRKLEKGRPGDALLLAAAGLRRLGYLQGDAREGVLRFDPPLPYRKLTIKEMIPAPGQAAIALEIRGEDPSARERLRSIHHAPTWWAVLAERAFLRSMGGGCASPVAAHAAVGPRGLRLKAIVQLSHGKIWRGEKNGPWKNAEALGEALGKECRDAERESESTHERNPR